MGRGSEPALVRGAHSRYTSIKIPNENPTQNVRKHTRGTYLHRYRLGTFQLPNWKLLHLESILSAPKVELSSHRASLGVL